MPASILPAGHTPTAAELLAWYNDLLLIEAEAAAWVPWTPVVTGTGWSTGNGSVTGTFNQTGKLARGRFAIIGGSTTNWGTGSLSVSLPITSAAGTGQALGTVMASLSAGGNRLGGWLFQNGSTSMAMVKEDGTRWTATVPLAFVSGSEIRGFFECETT